MSPTRGGGLASATFAALKRHMSPGSALAAKVVGGGAVEKTANGAVVTVSDGRQLLDFGSYGVALLGHRHPRVVAALIAELELMPTSTRVVANPVVAALAEELVRHCGGSLSRVWFGSDGSDAVEAALKLARRSSGRMRVLAVENAFHGKTLGALAATANPAFRKGVEPLLGAVSVIASDDPDAVARQVAKGDVAALIFEPIQGEAGVRQLKPALLQRWAADARAAGVFVISDEVQVGLGRCGVFSPSMTANLRPDAVLFGKALGGGLMPLSAMVATETLAAPLVADPTWHTSTFGGHPLCCAAGRATLSALEDAAEQGAEVGAAIAEGLTHLATEYPATILEVRGTGLIWGLEFPNPGAAGAALVELAHRGLLVSPCLSSNSTIRLLPPMVTSLDQVSVALEIIGATLPELSAYL